MKDLTGRVAIVTGASRGIGAAVAVRLAQCGASLFLAADDDQDHFDAVVARCQAVAPGEATFAIGQFDLGAEGAAERMVEAAVTGLGRVDFLVNNAGIRIRQPFGLFSYADFDRIVAVNVRAAIFASQAVLPHMRRVGGGRIVHMASQMAQVVEPTSALYGMTKAALVYLAKAMAYELAAENIVVNAISPGPIMTEVIAEQAKKNPDHYKWKLGFMPGGRYGTAEEIAEVVAFLFTTDATFLLGHDLVVDGGYTVS